MFFKLAEILAYTVHSLTEFQFRVLTNIAIYNPISPLPLALWSQFSVVMPIPLGGVVVQVVNRRRTYHQDVTGSTPCRGVTTKLTFDFFSPAAISRRTH